VLKLARLHGTDRRFKREPSTSTKILEEVVRDANFEGAVKNCTIRLQRRGRSPLHGNRELLHSAIENVLRNAVRYSPPEGRSRCGRRAKRLGNPVRDQGPGVPDADLERIFEPFYRVAESRDRDSGGEGIGLAITAQVLKAHGGSATARNPEGGLEVRLLPLAEPGGAQIS
jgi:signal transduction histidine kinase